MNSKHGITEKMIHELVERTTRAQGLPYYLEHKPTLEKIAALLRGAEEERAREDLTPREPES